jgi:hypothetical protein
MEVIYSSEKPVDYQRTMHRYVLEYSPIFIVSLGKYISQPRDGIVCTQSLCYLDASTFQSVTLGHEASYTVQTSACFPGGNAVSE